MNELFFPDDDRIEDPSDIFEPKTVDRRAWIRFLSLILIAIVVLMGVGFLATRFVFSGTNVSLVGSEIGTQELADIEKLIGLQLPQNTRGVEINFSGWQDYRCTAILQIDSNEVVSAVEILTKLEARPASIGIPSNLSYEIEAGQVLIEARGLWADFEYGYAALVHNNGVYYLHILWFTG